MTFTTILILVALFAWLVYETIQDLKDQNLPAWFSLAMLIPGVILLAVNRSIWPALLTTASVASTELYTQEKLPRWTAILCIVAPPALIVALFPSLWPLAFGWELLAVLWLANMIGGADALAGLALLLFFPSAWMMVFAILGGIVVWGVVLLVLKYRKDSALRIWTLLSAKARGGTFAGIGAYALAVLFFGVYLLATYGRVK